MQYQRMLDRLRAEEERNNALLHLTANEGRMSETARQFLGWRLSERYLYAQVRDPIIDNGRFTGLGLPGVVEYVEEAEEATKRMTGGSAVTLHSLSGIHAMMSAILSTTSGGDGVMTVRVEDGGHFATQNLVRTLERRHCFAAFDQERLSFDVEATAETFRSERATALYLDVSYYLNPHNLRELREALGPEAVIIYDASHVMGLILGNRFQDPFADGADVICANTHKTLPGPQKGMVVFKDPDTGPKAVASINFKLSSSPHIHHLLSLATTLLEMERFGLEYATTVIENSNHLGAALENQGFEIRRANTGRFSENHQVHVYIDKSELSGAEKYQRLLDNNISVAFNRVLGGRPFIRLGTQEVSRRGMKEAEMRTIAELIAGALAGESVVERTNELNRSFARTVYSFDTVQA